MLHALRGNYLEFRTEFNRKDNDEMFVNIPWLTEYYSFCIILKTICIISAVGDIIYGFNKRLQPTIYIFP